MNLNLIVEAADKIRKILEEKASYRRLLPGELVDVEVYLQQILLEVLNENDRPSLMKRVVKKIKGA